MRLLPLLFLALALGVAPLFYSCVSRTPDSFHTEPRSEQEQKFESLLKNYERKIKELDGEASAAAGALREELVRSLVELKKKHREAAKGLEELRAATNKTWNNVHEQLQRTLEELKKKLDNAREQAR